MEKKRQECLVYTRVCGWMAPTARFNKGKKAEYNDRVEYSADKALKNI